MSRFRRRCPNCGGRLEATAVRYLSDVVLDERDRVCSFRVSDINDADGYAWDQAQVYCENDCEVDWEPPSYAALWVHAPGDLNLNAQEFATLEHAVRDALADTADAEEARRLADLFVRLRRASRE